MVYVKNVYRFTIGLSICSLPAPSSLVVRCSSLHFFIMTKYCPAPPWQKRGRMAGGAWAPSMPVVASLLALATTHLHYPPHLPHRCYLPFPHWARMTHRQLKKNLHGLIKLNYSPSSQVRYLIITQGMWKFCREESTPVSQLLLDCASHIVWLHCLHGDYQTLTIFFTQLSSKGMITAHIEKLTLSFRTLSANLIYRKLDNRPSCQFFRDVFFSKAWPTGKRLPLRQEPMQPGWRISSWWAITHTAHLFRVEFFRIHHR